MLTFDLLVTILVAIGAFYGFKRGLVRQALGLVGIILGIYWTYRFSTILATWWFQYFAANKNNAQIISYIVMIIAASAIAMQLAKLVEKFLRIALLTWLNKLAGLFFGALQMILGLSAILFAHHALDLKTGGDIEMWLSNSATYNLLLDLAFKVFPYLKFS